MVFEFLVFKYYCKIIWLILCFVWDFVEVEDVV